MAKVESLGVHTPAALPYLIREGILPHEPKRSLYQWDTYVFEDSQGEIEEEVVATKHCVVWSQGEFVRNVFRFELEGEEVVQAILTSFPDGDSTQHAGHQGTHGLVKGGAEIKQKARRSLSAVLPGGARRASTTSRIDSASRALVIFLKTKAHIHFLKGINHIVDLPFEVERAFPAVRGCIVQRKATRPPGLPPTPHLPNAPPNSFHSSHLHPASSLLQSPTLTKGFGGSQPLKRSPLGGGQATLDTLFQDAFGSPGRPGQGDFDSLYSLTSPLSDFGVVTHAFQHRRPRPSSKSQSGITIEFEALDIAEEILYTSRKSEIGASGSLMLIASANYEFRTLTIWHAWYVSEKSLKDLLKQRVVQKAAKARRRSSFVSANMGTGAATPAVRPREGNRESLAAGTLRPPGDPSGQPTAPVSRKKTRQEEEAAMASQMDPDYQPATSQQPARESRRISSLNAELKTSQNASNASFATHGSRRNTSFGGPNDRKSFDHRKSRGSTPGSVFSRSFGPEDDLMDLDSNGDLSADENVDSILRHMRATIEAAGADSVFGNADANFNRDLVVRKLHSFPLGPKATRGTAAAQHRVVTLRDSNAPRSGHDMKLNVYLHDISSGSLSCLRLLVKQRTLWPELAQEAQTAIPTVIAEYAMGECADITKLRHGSLEAILLSGAGLILSPEAQEICRLPLGAPYRMYNPMEFPLNNVTTEKEVGRNRTLHLPEGTLGIQHAGCHGSFDEVDVDGTCHRRLLRLRPEDPRVERLLQVCEYVLPPEEALRVRSGWYTAFAWLEQHQEACASSASSTELIALVATVLRPVMPLLDSKARAALNLSRVAAGKRNVVESSALITRQAQQTSGLRARNAWSGMPASGRPSTHRMFSSPNTRHRLDRRADQLLNIAALLAEDQSLALRGQVQIETLTDLATECGVRLMLGLHIFREEQKLCILQSAAAPGLELACLIAQLGMLLGLDKWGSQQGTYYSLEGVNEQHWAFLRSTPPTLPHMPLMDDPVGVFQWIEHAFATSSSDGFPSLSVIAGLGVEGNISRGFVLAGDLFTPRLCALSKTLSHTSALTSAPTVIVEVMEKHGVDVDMLDTLPEAVAAPFREAIAKCEREPPTSWSNNLLQLVGRDDLQVEQTSGCRGSKPAQADVLPPLRDVQSVCHALDHANHPAKTREAGRNAISNLIFSEDRRLVDAVHLMRYQQPTPQVGECPKQPDWTDAQHFEQQRRVMHFVALRMLSLPSGDSMIHFRCETPLLTEKYPVSGFSSICLMQPMAHVLTIDRSGMSEEKYGWAYFHAGVSAGLRISQTVTGIDTSWIAFNKPNELTNRHAGLLLALGLGGHLRSLAKWLSFKYLTPKHTMTSVGLLLGLSASYLGTMDGLITRMLSVHITRMLPAGAAELNVSPTTQTAGLMGVGLLYYNTQHRRMSEIMLSEVEYMEIEDPDSGPDPLRDESYRLAAGFALGFINLGKGRHLRGLHGMYLPERLLAVAVGPRPVHAVHVFDRATAGAVMAIAMIYMKSGDQAIARKIDIPDTEAQFDHVRPDMLMLRAMARHIVTWENILAQSADDNTHGWIHNNLPKCYKARFDIIDDANGKYPFSTSDVPFYNIATGLAWAMGLKYAGSGNETARDEILYLLDIFHKINGESYYYDAKLARATVRRCIDVLALSAATVMAGTGDLDTFRRLRRLHGRIDAETPYGSHLAAHMAIGVLFMGGGTYTLGTSDFAIASLMCAFYPLFPMDVHDNRVHLQALRHFWVFAAEARCLTIQDLDTHRPISMPVLVTLRDGSSRIFSAPCLLPEIDSICSIQTQDPAYWRVTLDFVSNPAHLTAFRNSQVIHARRCPASEAHNSAFSATLTALNDAKVSDKLTSAMISLFDLPGLGQPEKAEIELVLPPDLYSSMLVDERGTVLDDRLAFSA
ncbi:hypothetical protein B0A50_04028 [Salinomyces thailandicus]|uniref:Anaphase-promoting complex subunit 1 N-terminal domain-containing protein n=1 Tax=Salinomyces thailandicus TaxID=706561 RepID=A0A4U0U0I7_9PEZI|nr:hypothetical protein B0A50_04028 [Salinomyces thailandica]